MICSVEKNSIGRQNKQCARQLRSACYLWLLQTQPTMQANPRQTYWPRPKPKGGQHTVPTRHGKRRRRESVAESIEATGRGLTQRYGCIWSRTMAGRSESDYREVVFDREGKEPLHGFMRVDHGMVIVSGYGRHKERRLGASPPELTARLLLSELASAARGQAGQKTESPEENGS